MQDMLRFITCGSVDDGKSTLIGRLLYDSKMIFQDQLASVKRDSKKYGTRGDDIDLALLVDGLQNEREQSITIDVAYRYFSTKKRKFIIADTPGHEQYTRNMATGASSADLALILIDAKKGVLTQTKRHSYIVSLLGIKNIIVVINKMDLVAWSKLRYKEIEKEYQEMLSGMPKYKSINFTYIPISALYGDNIVNSSDKMPWYNGEVLMDMLENIKISQRGSDDFAFRFPVQYVNRPDSEFRGFCGDIVGGSIKAGEEIKVLPSGKKSRIKSLLLPSIDKQKLASEAFAPMAVTIVLEDEIDICRGDIIVKTGSDINITDTFEAMLIWMSETPLDLDANYIVKRATSLIGGKFSSVIYRVDIDTLEHKVSNKVGLNDIVKCTLELDREMAIDTYEQNRYTGSFIVIDRYSNDTLAAGMIVSKTSDISPSDKTEKKYSQLEKELNSFIRKHYPYWNCKSI